MNKAKRVIGLGVFCALTVGLVAMMAPAAPTTAEYTPETTRSHKAWGGLDPNLYRKDYTVRPFAASPADPVTLAIAPGMPIAEIQKRIDAAPTDRPLLVQFAAGEHHLNEKLVITRSDVTLAGEGIGKTTLVADFAPGKIDNLIQIQSPDLRNDIGPNNGRWIARPKDRVTGVMKSFALGDQKLAMQDSGKLKADDVIMIFKPGRSRDTKDYPEFGTLAKIDAIAGKTLTLAHKLAFGVELLGPDESLADVSVYRTNLLHDVVIRDFSLRYAIPDDAVNNPNSLPAGDIRDTVQYNFYPDYAAGAGGKNGNLRYGHQRAIVIAGTFRTDIRNIAMKDVGSGGLFLSGNLELRCDNLSVDGTFNKGRNGNGYGLEYDKTYYSDLTNLRFHQLRHALSANILGGNGYNNFHIADTDSNLDFHGGRDQGNIYYTEKMAIHPYYNAVNEDGKPTPAVDYDYGRTQFSLVSYRLGNQNAAENMVIWDHAVAADGVRSDDGKFTDAEGKRIAPYHANNEDYLVASPQGGVLKAGFGSDILVSGAGNDRLSGGTNVTASHNSDLFAFPARSGDDVIADFEPDFDQLRLEITDGQTVEDILAAARQNDADTLLVWGSNNYLTLKNIDKSALNTWNVKPLSNWDLQPIRRGGK